MYSLFLYIWRVDKIRKRRDVKRVYYERWGPTVVSVGLVVIILINFALRVRAGGFMAEPSQGSPDLPGRSSPHKEL